MVHNKLQPLPITTLSPLAKHDLRGESTSALLDLTNHISFNHLDQNLKGL